jgi:hypothetical protein
MLEGEQVLADVAQATVKEFLPDPSTIKRRGSNALGTALQLPAALKSGVLPLQDPHQHFDLALFVSHNAFDLTMLNQSHAVLGKTDQLVVVLCELWPTDLAVPKFRLALQLLQQAALIVVTHVNMVKLLEPMFPGRVMFRPSGVDVLRFRSRGAKRTINVFAPGRRPRALHQRLIERLQDDPTFVYEFDTFQQTTVIDRVEHRMLYQSRAERAVFMACFAARLDTPDVHGGITEHGMRYGEAMAAGAIPIGHPIADERYTSLFPEPMRVIPVGTDGEGLEQLDALSPHVRRAIRDTNFRVAASAWDWSHHWIAIRDALEGSSAWQRSVELDRRLKALGSSAITGQRFSA